MEIENTSNNEEYFRKEYKVSWVGYFRFIAINFVLYFIGMSIATSILADILKPIIDKETVILLFVIAIIAILVLGIKNTKAQKLVIDHNGVWKYSGIFPWNRGRNGISWEFIEDAAFYVGFIPWATKSYTVIVRGGYRELNEFTVKYIKNGDDAVGFINDYSRKLRRSSR
ncbi:hypothetical protein [uncultured Cardiobacterium sp.]|jgi:hypothetical protein|uniref:hypothetical protein n=1 Tax=uncultured Cardiobacterium sp. TaxID=417619 RepID=UPI0026217A64|nr:hypothetical protein [uncultured Cardiobacterium sp.]